MPWKLSIDKAPSRVPTMKYPAGQAEDYGQQGFMVTLQGWFYLRTEGWKPQGEVSPKWQSPGFMVIRPRDWKKEQRWQTGRWACSKHTEPQLFPLTGPRLCATRSPTYIQVQSCQISLKKKIKIKHFCLFPAHYSEKTILQVCINNLIGSVSLKPDISFSFCENTQSITKMLICREAVHWEKPYSIISILNDKK